MLSGAPRVRERDPAHTRIHERPRHVEVPVVGAEHRPLALGSAAQSGSTRPSGTPARSGFRSRWWRMPFRRRRHRVRCAALSPDTNGVSTLVAVFELRDRAPDAGCRRGTRGRPRRIPPAASRPTPRPAPRPPPSGTVATGTAGAPGASRRNTAPAHEVRRVEATPAVHGDSLERRTRHPPDENRRLTGARAHRRGGRGLRRHHRHDAREQCARCRRPQAASDESTQPRNAHCHDLSRCVPRAPCMLPHCRNPLGFDSITPR